ncbi:GGDEF-domain containing protein [Blastococcus sp. TF02-09]|uniref:putative bifunctional diguanylate cyclase/phosphodiesterase n=1 Tax=Blastococcus sp. TF02-09 TaxID=2250576 RepID=UPI000DEA3962|nr:EAL domain-containing protein [Blastococcus sp. TF02-9]RBY79360.1 GGDEF-domain containing protein [Blastococcus sp. TF02-9]
MPDARARLLPGSPRTALACVGLAAAGSVAVGIAPPGAGSGPRPLAGLFGVLLCAALATVLVWRARQVHHERTVWSRIALGTIVSASGIVVAIVLSLIPATRTFAFATAMWAPVLAFPIMYGGLVRWNRYSTSLGDPNDLMNGMSGVLAVVAALNLVLAHGDVLDSSPWWQIQPLVAQVAAGFVLVGTALTLPFIGAMGRDPRTWLVVVALGTGLAASALALFSDEPPTGWTALIGPAGPMCLAVAAVLQPARTVPQPADAKASTIGSFTVVAASTSILLLAMLVDGAGAATACAALAALGASVRMLANVRELSQLAVSRREALTDELTGLPNRRAVLRRIEALSAEGAPVALALLDLDKFKEVNDALGHSSGDHLLRLVAQRLETALRAGDLLGRLGGDEFAVVAVLDGDVPADEAGLALGRRLHDRLAQPFPLDGMSVHCSASIGVTTSTEDGRRPSVLLRRADVTMYDAKRSGSGVALYDPAVHSDSSGHLALVEQLRTALTTDQLVLHHQPQLDITDGRVVGVECLVRWTHPERGLIPPAQFLPLAEVHGLMGPLTERVLESAIAQAADWRGRGLDLRVSVNLSASNLLDTGLPARLAELLTRHEVPPRSVVLEVTETVLLTDPERSLAVVADLAALGVSVSIDDFGTGYSSLAYLRDLPVTELKLDRSFTTDLCTDRRTEAIIASTIDLAHRLGLGVVAEGVEDDETLAHLRTLGCDTSQGFLHSPALPAPVLERWLLEREAAPAAG